MDKLSVSKNKLAARLLKAEMLGDTQTMENIKLELAQLKEGSSSKDNSPRIDLDKAKKDSIFKDKQDQPGKSNINLKRLNEDDMTINEMYLQQKTGSVQDEVKIYLSNHKKFAKDSQDTSQFSEELDDSQLILKGKPKNSSKSKTEIVRNVNKTIEFKPCDNCPQTKHKHLILWEGEHIYVSLLPFKLNLSHLSSIVIRNLGHDYKCFLDSDEECQKETQNLISCLKSCWDKQNYQCIILESYYKNFTNHKNNLLPSSGGNHFQLYCIPIKKRYFEEARLYFKQALLECEKEWSMNKKLVITTDEKKIQSCLPRGLSYFWVCFDSLNKGFGHVIEDEERFSRYFGFDILAGLLDKSIHDILHPRKEDYNDQFERARLFKLNWSQFKPD